MITKEEIIEIFENAVLDTLNKTDGFSYGFDDAADAILQRISWKPISTAPKNRPIIVWAYSSAEWWKFNIRQRTCFPVEWENVWDRWIVLGGADDGDGQPFIALDPIAWMELPDGPK